MVNGYWLQEVERREVQGLDGLGLLADERTAYVVLGEADPQTDMAGTDTDTAADTDTDMTTTATTNENYNGYGYRYGCYNGYRQIDMAPDTAADTDTD